MSNPPEDEFIVSMPDGSLDDLFAGLEKSLKNDTPEPAPKEQPPEAPVRLERRRAKANRWCE